VNRPNNPPDGFLIRPRLCVPEPVQGKWLAFLEIDLMNKQELCEHIAYLARTQGLPHITRPIALLVLDLLKESLIEALLHQEGVYWEGVGSFEPIVVKYRPNVRYRASKALLQALDLAMTDRWMKVERPEAKKSTTKLFETDIKI
jgi:hypothetical protein